jgi:ATP-dependent exoDNAse (exonuclease V) alpha subunit
MSLYHCYLDPVQRSQGQIAVHTAAYFRGAKMYDQRTGTTTDYRHKSEAVYSKLFVNKDAPEWVQELIKSEEFAKGEDKHIASEIIWNKSEMHNSRVNSQTANKWTIALQLELTVEQNIEIVEKIAKTLAKDGTVVDANIHWNSTNPHAHILESQNFLTEDGFGLKNRYLNTDDRLLLVRKEVANIINQTLEKYGHNIRVDHRSYKDRGLNLTPTVKRGASFHMEKRGVETRKQYENQEITEENFQKIANDPEIILTKLSQERTDFTMGDVASEAIRYISIDDILAANDSQKDDLSKADLDKVMDEVLRKNAVFDERAIASELNIQNVRSEQFIQILETIKGSDEIMYLGVGDDGRDRYTTKSFFKREMDMQDDVDKMAKRMKHYISRGAQTEYMLNYEQKMRQKIDGFKFSSEQQKAIRHLLSTGDVTCLTGRAGTGKTSVLSPCVEAWKGAGYNTIGLATALVAANALDECGFDDTRSFASLFHCIDEYDYNPIDKNTVVVVDEASMVPSEHLARLVKICKKVKAKLVLVGDPMQLSGVLGGAPFRAIIERIGSALLSCVIRQEKQWMRDASIEFALGNTRAGLEAYLQHEKIHLCDTDESTKQQLLKDWQKDPLPLEQKIIACHENDDVKYFNDGAREKLVASGYLGKSHTLTMVKYANNKSYKVQLDIAKNDRVIIDSKGQAPRKLLSNNQFGTITDIKLNENNNIQSIELLLDGQEKPLNLTAKDMRDKYIVLGRGYASTTHKVQGATKGSLYGYISRMMDRMLTYVMATRHKGDCHLYASHEQFEDFDALALRAGKASIKDSVLDFAYNFALRRGFEVEQLTGLKKVWTEKIISGPLKVKEFFERAIDPEKYAAKIENKERLQQQRNIQEKGEQQSTIKRENAKVVAKYRELNSASGQAWSEVAKEARKLGHWNYTDNRPELQNMVDTAIYKEAVTISNNANKAATDILKDINKYEQILLEAGISIDSLKVKEQKYQLTKSIELYQQDNQEKLLYAHQIVKALDDNLSLYPQIKDAKLDLRQLQDDARTYQYQEYYKTLQGKELANFALCDKYNELTKQRGELYKEYVAQKQQFIKEQVDNLTGANRNSIKPTLHVNKHGKLNNMNVLIENACDHFMEINQPKDNIEIEGKKTHNINSIDNEPSLTRAVKINEIYGQYLSCKEKSNEAAYNIDKVMAADQESIQTGSEFFNIENWANIQELEIALEEAENAPSHIDNKAKVKALEAQLNYFANKQDKFKQDVKSYECIVNLQNFKDTKDIENASNVREFAKNNNHVYFKAVEMGVNWDELIQAGEQHSYKKVEAKLSLEEKGRYKVVQQYLELARTKGISYDHNMQLKHQKSKLAHTIISKLEEYKEVLEFYHIATNDENYSKREISNFEYLQKQASIYSDSLKLVEEYHKETDINKKQQVKDELINGSYGSKQNEFLRQQFGKDFIEVEQYNDSILETKLCYKEYAKAKQQFIVNKVDELVGAGRNSIKPTLYINKKGELDNTSLLIKDLGKQLTLDKLTNNFGKTFEQIVTSDGRYINVVNNIHKSKEDRIQDLVSSMPLSTGAQAEQLLPYSNTSTKDTKQITIDQLEQYKEEWQVAQGIRNSKAHELQNKSKLDIGLEFFKLGDNQRRIGEINEQLENIDLSAKERQKLVKEAGILQDRAGYIETHANIEECHLRINAYKRNIKEQITQTSKVFSGLSASNVRAMFEKDMYGVCYGMARERKVNWNKLLTQGEEFDREKINPSLDTVQKQAFDKVKEYLELDRAASKTFMDCAINTYKKSVLAKDMLDNIEQYKEAFKFYQIALNKDEGHKHEISAFKRITKFANNYNKIVELVSVYEKSDSEQKQAIAEQIMSNSYSLIREGYLNSSDELKVIRNKLKVDQVQINLQKAIENNVYRADRVLGYVEAIHDSRLYWGTLSQMKEMGADQETLTALKELAIEKNESRNEKAYFLYMNKDLHQEALDIGKIKNDKLEQQASDHREKKLATSLEDPKQMISEYLEARKSYVNIFANRPESITLDNLSVVQENHAVGKAIGNRSQSVKKLVAQDTLWLDKAESYAINLIQIESPSYNKEEQERIAKAGIIARNANRVTKDTPVKSYLLGRNITIDPSYNIRFGYEYNYEKRKDLPVMVCVARYKDKDLRGVQTIFLEQGKDGVYTKAELKGINGKKPVIKKSKGVLVGSGCLVNEGEGKSVAICEGPETALALATACPKLKIYCTLSSGNMKTFQLSDEDKGKDVYICHDNDGVDKKVKDMEFLKQVSSNLSKQGSDVYLAMPKSIKGLKKTDINDMLCNKNARNPIGDIRKCIDRAVLLEAGVTHERLAYEFEHGKQPSILRDSNGKSSEFEGKTADDMYEKLFDIVKANNHKYQQEYFVTYQINRITQDIGAYRRQYNREPSEREVNAIIKRAQFEGQAIEQYLENTIKEQGDLSKNEMWDVLVNTREAAMMSGLSYQNAIDNDTIAKNVIDDPELAQSLMEYFTKKIGENEQPNYGNFPESSSRYSQLVQYHTDRFIAKYGEEPSLENQKYIEEVARLHDSQLSSLFVDSNDKLYMSYVHADSEIKNNLVGVDEMEQAPRAIKEIKDAIDMNLTRKEVEKIKDSMDFENAKYIPIQAMKQDKQISGNKARDIEIDM